MALLFSHWDKWHGDYDYDNEVEQDEEEEEEDFYKKSEVELVTVTNSLCEEKMNFTLHPGQMCAGGEEGRDYCKVEVKINQTVLQKLKSSDKERAKKCLSVVVCGQIHHEQDFARACQ